MNKLQRLQKLYGLLVSGEKYLTAPELANRLDVSPRTIYRDLQELESLGCPVEHDCGYHIPKNCNPFPFQVSKDDLRMIQDLIDTSPLSQFPHLQEQYQHLRARLNFLFGGELESENVICNEPFISDQLKFSLEDLEKATWECKSCLILYHALDEEEPSYRTIHPYGMLIRMGQWYLIALDADKRDFRIYKLLRIQELLVTDTTFQRDPSFQFDTYFEDSWNVFHGSLQTVRMRVRGIAARLITERSFPKKMEMQWLNPEEAVVTVTIRGEKEIVNWVLGMGTDAEILSPPELREQVRQILSASFKQYED